MSDRTDYETAGLDRPAEATQSLGRLAATGAIWITIDMVATQGISLLVFLVLARFLSPHDFGLVSIGYTLAISIKLIFVDSVIAALLRKHTLTSLDYTTVFWLLAVVAALLSLLLLGVSGFADTLFHSPGLDPVIKAMAFLVVGMTLSRTQDAWLVKNFQFRTLGLRSIAASVVGGTAGVISAASGAGIWALVILQNVTMITSLSLLWFVCPWRPTFAFSRTAAAEMTRFALSICSSNFLGVVNENVDTLLIGFIWGPVGAGLYNMAKRLRLALQSVTAAPVNGIAMPTIAAAQSDDARLSRVILSTTRMIFTLCTPICVGLSALSGEAVVIFFGEKWSAAAPVLAVLAIGSLPSTLIGLYCAVFVVQNRPRWAFYLAGLFTVIAFVSVFGFGKSDIAILAVPFVLPFVVTLPLSIEYLCRVTTITRRQWVATGLPQVCAAAIMYVVLIYLEQFSFGLPAFVQFFVVGGIGTAAYLLVLLVISPSALTDAIKIVRR
jgi:O-antigen/teichoic acid export membrane protein